jgi:hypothetical protein
VKRFCIHAVLALAAVLALSAGVGVATGAIPSTSDGTISACQAKIGGVRYLRPIDKQASESCKASEKAVNWNQKGPKGDPGPQGLKGATGPAGSGQGKVRFVLASETIAAGHFGQVDAKCAAGEHVSGGGFALGLLGDEDLRVATSNADPDANKWVVEAENNTNQAQDVIAQAVCAS